MADRLKETWPCGDCGHKHYVSQDCPDHQWTDCCPYEGLNCPSTEERAARLARLDASFPAEDATLDDLLPPAED